MTESETKTPVKALYHTNTRNNYMSSGASSGEGGGLPSPMWEIRKKCHDFVKNALIVSIFELNFSVKM